MVTSAFTARCACKRSGHHGLTSQRRSLVSLNGGRLACGLEQSPTANEPSRFGLPPPFRSVARAFLSRAERAATWNRYGSIFQNGLTTTSLATRNAGGWIQALHYFSGRTAESEKVWQHWTRLDAEWRLQRPSVYPAFEQWHQDAVGAIKSTDERTALCAQYVEWEAFTSWVGCVVECAHEVPALVASELERRYPGFVAHARSQRVKPCSDPQWLSSELLKWIESHADAPESLTDDVRAAARAHLRGERIIEYAAVCSLTWSRQPPPTFPNFEPWLADADGFIAI